jgi:hypothetical protein
LQAAQLCLNVDNMNLWYSLLLQGVMAGIQVINCTSHITREQDVKVLVGTAIGLVQILLHWHSGTHTPDGSNAAGSYEGPKKG